MTRIKMNMRPLGNGRILGDQHLDHDVRVAGLDNPVTPDVEDLDDFNGDAAITKADKLRPYAEFKSLALVAIGTAVRGFYRRSGDDGFPALYGAGQDVHAWRTYEMADKGMARLFKELDGRADLHDLAVLHHYDLISERESLCLVVGHINHRAADSLMQLLELRAQHPFEMRIDDGQRLIEHNYIDVRAYQAATQRDFLLAVGGKSRGTSIEHPIEFKHVGDFAHAPVDITGRDGPIA